MEKTQVVGQLSGKTVYKSPVHNADDSELEKYFSKFNFIKLVLSISKLAENVYCANEVPPNIKGTSYNDDILCRALELAIKYASKRIPDEQDLVNVLQYAAGEAEKYQFSGIAITNPIKASPAEAEIVAMRIAYTQFSENSYNLIARYWCLFAHLWWEGRKSLISPLDDLNKLIGVSYRELIVYGMYISQTPFVCNLTAEEEKEFATLLKEDYSENGFENFLNYFSCNQEEWSCSGIPPICNLKPLVKINQESLELNKIVYFAPAKYKLMSRITSGLYFDLCDKYKGKDKENPFKQEFGEVFEKYVGEILKHSLTSYTISPEIVYKEGKNEVKSVDFFVRKDENLVLVEVKQSSLFAGSKISGIESDLLEDLKKTVLKATKQINKSKKNIVEKANQSFESYFDCKNIIGLIVVNDPLYNANDICRKIISKEGVTLDDTYMINVSDLEDFLDLQIDCQDFWNVLAEKKTNFENFDFKEYLRQKYDYSKLEHHFLEKYYKEVLPW